MAFNATQIEAALKHLRRSDPVMRNLIRQVGAFKLRPQRDRFGMLVRSIVSQQISTAAAISIRMRLEQLVAPARLDASHILALPPERLRAAGLSPQKLRYLTDLAGRVASGALKLHLLGRRSDEEVIEQLTDVLGIGRWTAQMFLIFALGRLDVFPHDDLGVRSAIKQLYSLPALPDRASSHEIARPWRPYATVASWYCWRSLELGRRLDRPRGTRKR